MPGGAMKVPCIRANRAAPDWDTHLGRMFLVVSGGLKLQFAKDSEQTNFYHFALWRGNISQTRKL